MELRVMRYFLAVAREESITAAAQALHVTQPTLSKQLMELEAELGKKLFLRGSRKITLTEEGMFFRKRAQEILRDVYAAERAAMERTCSRFSPEFVEAVGYFADCLLEELNQRGGQGAAGKGNEREEDVP